MYFWKIGKLKEELIVNGLSQKALFVYIVIYVVLAQLFTETNHLFPSKDAVNIADYIQSAIEIFIVGFGTYGCYYANGAAKGHQFVERYFSIGLVTNLRFLAILLPLTIALGFIEGYLLKSDAINSASPVIHYAAKAVAEIWLIALFWRIALHINEVAKASAHIVIFKEDRHEHSAAALTRANADNDSAPISTWAQHTRYFIKRIWKNIRAGAKIAFLRRITFDDLEVSWAQLISLLLISILLPLVSQICSVGFSGRFLASGLTGILFIFPLMVVTAGAIAKLARQEQATLALITVLLSASLSVELVLALLPPLLKAMSLQRLYNRYGVDPDIVTGYWLAFSAALALTRLLQLSLKQRVVAGLIAGLILIVPMNYVWRDSTLWSAPYDDEAYRAKMSTYRAAAEEEVLYLQPKLLDDQLKNISPGRPGSSNVYFIGMAGDAEQDVFMKEINSVEQLFEQRFAVATHTIKLINNRSTLKSFPIASTTSLDAAIERVGKVMNSDNDILFLYLTSHGSRDHKFSIQLHPLELKDLEPQDLRRMLDKAQIKWRVIVVAACYSGGFIDAIKSDNTLVITAAAGDRTSFGCSNENDYTYFGKAYFVDGLKNTNSFIKAFDIAKENVTKREKKDGFEPSNPQISIGKNIEAELGRLENNQSPLQPLH